MRVAVIGGVASTALLVDKLHEHRFESVKVWGYAPTDVSRVSGWIDLAGACQRWGYPHQVFVRVDECVEAIVEFQPDLIFAVGLSQLIPSEILRVPSKGCIGFHPTALPKGRGRAPIAWLILDRGEAAASFFVIREGVDDGPILAQKPCVVSELDDAGTVEKKVLSAEAMALDMLLPRLAAGWFGGVEQDHRAASWYGRRAPEDGWIDWHNEASDIARLIRASARPHPGTFTYSQDVVVTIWQAKAESGPWRGVVGRVLEAGADGEFVVQCGRDLLRIQKWESSQVWVPRAGQKLGYYPEAEIHRLRLQCSQLNGRIEKLEKALHLIGRSI